MCVIVYVRVLRVNSVRACVLRVDSVRVCVCEG